MFHQLKITSFAIIVALVPFLFLSSPATGIEEAASCKGWACDIEGQVCPEGVPGASDASYMCTNSKWVAMSASDHAQGGDDEMDRTASQQNIDVKKSRMPQRKNTSSRE